MELGNLASDRSRKAIEELVKGRAFATQLRHIINGDDGSAIATPSAEELAQKVLKSFTNALLLLSNPNSESSEVSTMQPAKSEDSQESNCKSTPAVMNRRGCYKRRRTSQIWEKESETPVEDGHQWRKYGQKVILNTTYPRNYYRCTHKYDQKCQATKQVQRIQEEPPLYKTTYYGHHTCRNLHIPDIILDSADSPSDHSSQFLSFDNSALPPKQGFSFLSSLKKECKEEIEIPSSSSNDYMLSSELTFDHSSRLESDDHKDVISGDLCDFVELGVVFEPFV